jgi:hypothetical protein
VGRPRVLKNLNVSGRAVVDPTMSTVKLIWKCNKPNSQAVVRLCESLMIQAAEAYGMDTAVIRQIGRVYSLSIVT